MISDAECTDHPPSSVHPGTSDFFRLRSNVPGLDSNRKPKAVSVGDLDNDD